MKKRILSLLITVSLMLSAVVFVSAADTDLPFTDVKAGKWYSDAVATVYAEGIMEGKSEGVFAPFENMTRAQLVTILSRLANADTAGCADTLTFKDTKKSAWYADAVGWSVTAGLVNGYDDNTFRPNAQVLRQELAVLFARFLTANSISLPNVENPVTFTDANKIPSWAAEGVEVMRLTGIVGGDNNGNFNPKKSANRAEIAVMLTRYLAALENAVDPMHEKLENINSLTEKFMNKILIKLYNYERFTDYGFKNSVSEQVLPQLGLSTDVYEMVSTKTAIVNVNDGSTHSVYAGGDDVTEPFFIRNKVTGEVTETKNLGFVIRRIKTVPIEPEEFDVFMDRGVYEKMKDISLVSTGNIARFAKAFAKAEKGESITVGYIGGSITQGAISGAQRQHSYAHVTHEWLQNRFPNTEVKYVNAGIGGTPSEFGNFRAEPHLLSHNPDIIFIEFSVNDNAENAVHRETYEALVRRSLNDENAPAVALIVSALASEKASANAKEVADHYGLPIVNIDYAIDLGIEKGEFTIKEYAPDGIHPYEWGHRVMAGMITNMLENVMALTKTATDAELTVTAVPEKTLTPCNFDNLMYLDHDDFTDAQKKDWELVEDNGWDSPYKGTIALTGTAGDKLSFTVEAKNLIFLTQGFTGDITVNGNTITVNDLGDYQMLYSSDTATTLTVELTASADSVINGFSYN
ncbi:MAG: S-layer homology domain-containing protein [Clostridia bacterium]|nr:S-layer homology domain-containing protein [Clostridia bacterium]